MRESAGKERILPEKLIMFSKLLGVLTMKDYLNTYVIPIITFDVFSL